MNNTALNYIVAGKGIPVVFQHGLGAEHHQILDLVDHSEFQLITSDSRGHGKSPIGNKRPSFNNYTNDIIEILDNENIDRAVFGGLSMGSGIAINAAIRYPERVAGIIMLRPAWLCEGYPENLGILKEIASHLTEGKTTEEFRDHKILKEIRSEFPAAADSIEGMFKRVPSETTPLILNEMVADRPCQIEELMNINVPAIVIGNENDPLHPWEVSEQWARMLGVTAIRVPSRYTDPVTHKERVNQEIIRFIRKLKTI